MQPLLRLVAVGIIVGAARLHAASADTLFETLARTFIEDYLRTNPEQATQLGDHRFDHLLTDYSASAITAETAQLRRYRDELGRIDARGLTGANRIDARILALEIDAALFQLTEERPQEWNPLSYNDSLASAVYAFVARDFAPAEQRLRSAIQRTAAIPRVIEQIRAILRNPPRIHTETAIQQTAGAIGLLGEGLDPLLDEVPALKPEFAAVQEKAIAALAGYKEWLEKRCCRVQTASFASARNASGRNYGSRWIRIFLRRKSSLGRSANSSRPQTRSTRRRVRCIRNIFPAPPSLRRRPR